MQLQKIIIHKTESHQDIDRLIDFEHARIKAAAYEDAKHNGLKNPVLPLADGDNLIHYIGFKSSYEGVIIKVLEELQPPSQIAEGEMDKAAAEKHSRLLNEKIEKMNKQAGVHKKELGDFDYEGVNFRIFMSTLASVVIFAGEAAINTSAFAVTGDNLFYTMLLSVSTAFVISMGAHIAGRQYKEAETKLERRRIVIISFIGITALSVVITSLRSMFWKKMGIDINPLHFTVFNMAFFLMAAISTRYTYPFQSEIDRYREGRRKHKLVLKMEKEAKKMEEELFKHEKSSRENLKVHLRTLMRAEYAVERIKVHYRECFEVYKAANLACRKDIPTCFSQALPDLNIPQINFMSIIKKYKTDENTNNHPDHTAD